MPRQKHGPLILTNSLRRPWTSHGFQTSWRIAATQGRHRRRDVSRSARHRRHAPRHRRLHRGARSRPSPGTRCATCARSSTPTICTAIRRSARARSGSSKQGDRNDSVRKKTVRRRPGASRILHNIARANRRITMLCKAIGIVVAVVIGLLNSPVASASRFGRFRNKSPN